MSEARFEDLQAELNEIVGRLERGDVPVDEALELWQRGDELLRLCRERLALAEAESRSSRTGPTTAGLAARPKTQHDVDYQRERTHRRRTCSALCRAGDEDAWRELVERFSRYVYAITTQGFRLAPDEADDVFQDVFARAYERLDTLRSDEALRPWIGQLARRCCLDRLRPSTRAAGGARCPGGSNRRGRPREARGGDRRARGARRSVAGLPGGTRPLFLPRRELSDDRRRARPARRNDRKPDLAVPDTTS